MEETVLPNSLGANQPAYLCANLKKIIDVSEHTIETDVLTELVKVLDLSLNFWVTFCSPG